MVRAGTGHSQSSFSTNPSDYKLLEEVGYGASATVFRAIYLCSNEVVAVKCLDLDRCNSNLDDMSREAQTMSLIDHPNVIRAFCSFVVERNLWVVMPFMAEGSCLHLMKIAYPDGFEEAAIRSILKESLKALDYLHRQGHIHRDVKAGNILLDTNGMVKLGDFGVSACMFEAGDRRRSRNTFVGTPCWMAPEVLQPGSGYNSKADIWSFGITALELARGHAPFSKYPPMKVLLMAIQNAPPGLDSDNDKRFSKSFKDMVAMCLVKDQTKRPTAEKLLKHSFFKHAKPPELSVKKLFTDLPPLWNRVKAIQLKDAAQLASKKMPSAEQEAISQSEYQRGVSAWNFDVEDLKVQASLVQDDDDDDVSEIKEENESTISFVNNKDSVNSLPSFGKLTLEDDVKKAENNGPTSRDESSEIQDSSKDKTIKSDLEKSGLKERIGLRNNGMSSEPSNSEKDFVLAKTKSLTARSRQTRSGPLMPVLGHSATEKGRFIERYDNKSQPAVEKPVQRAPSFSGPLMLPTRASSNSLSAPIKSSTGSRDSSNDKSKAANLVQIKGRFSVTSENLDLVKDVPLSTVSHGPSQIAPLRKSASVGDWIFDAKQKPGNQIHNVTTSFLTSQLQNLFQQNTIQQDLILNLLNNLQPTEATDASQNGKLPLVRSENNGSVEIGAAERERLLFVKITELRTRMNTLTDELNAERSKYIHLQHQLKAVSGVGENGD